MGSLPPKSPLSSRWPRKPGGDEYFAGYDHGQDAEDYDRWYYRAKSRMIFGTAYCAILAILAAAAQVYRALYGMP